MRIRIKMYLGKSLSIPINHQYALTSVIYSYLKSADVDYASFLHQTGYGGCARGGTRRFKLFCFSTLRARRRMVNGCSLTLGPGEVEWFVTSPVEKFLQEFASGLLRQEYIDITGHQIPVCGVETVPSPNLGTSVDFSCLTPIVCSRTVEGCTHARYLTPADPAFGEAVRHNLIRKYFTLHGKSPHDSHLKWQWDDNYLQRGRGTKLIEYKSTFIKGAFAPFRVEGSEELIKLLYETGAGEKNSGGFGMVEVRGK